MLLNSHLAARCCIVVAAVAGVLAASPATADSPSTARIVGQAGPTAIQACGTTLGYVAEYNAHRTTFPDGSSRFAGYTKVTITGPAGSVTVSVNGPQNVAPDGTATYSGVSGVFFTDLGLLVFQGPLWQTADGALHWYDTTKYTDLCSELV